MRTLISLVITLLVAGALAGCGKSETPADRPASDERTGAPAQRFGPSEQSQLETGPNAGEVGILPETASLVDTTEAAPADARMAAGSADARGAAESAYAAGERLFNAGDYPGAAAALTEALGAPGDRAAPYFLLGLCQRRLGESEAAIASFKQALDCNPQHLRARVNLARALNDAGKPEEALSELEAAEGVDLEFWAVWNVRGCALLELQRPAEAETAFAHAVELAPDNAHALNNLGYARILQRRYSESLAPLVQATEQANAPAYAFNNLGVALEHTGDLAGAAKAYAVAVERGHGWASAALERVRGEEPDLAHLDAK
jgi:tetratricopeptide (TPR) repeat protein